MYGGTQAHAGQPRVRSQTHLAASASRLALGALIVAYACLTGGLALHRHAALETQALDLGYADQVAWNTSQGRLFQFSLFAGEAGEYFDRDFGRGLSHGPGADRESLLAYHVELLYLPLGLIYRLWPGPVMLTVLLTAVLALGAVPAYRLALHELGHRGAALAFGALYLAMPAIQGANVSDFHPVSMAAPLLLLALLFLVQRRTVPYVLTAVLCASLKEEVGLAVAMTGLYAWARCGRRTLGIVVALASLAWVGLCVAVIIPRHAGGAASPFLPRYQDALTQLTAFLPSVLTGSPASPVPEYALRYTLHMVASAGVLAVLAPLELAIAAPLLAINGLSASNWQHGGGAHYSSEVAGPLLVAGIAGCRRAAAWLARALAALPSGRGGAPPHTHASLALVAPAMLCLAVGMTQSAAEGVLPPAYRFTWPEFDARAAYLQPLLHRLPPDASVSAQSNLVPHVSRRARVYVFPTVADAQFVLLDVIGTSAPLGPDALYDRITALLSDGEFKVLAADHGFLLLERGAKSDPVLAPGLEGPDPDDVVQAPPFLAFVRGDVAESLPTQGPVFGDLVELVGQRVTPLPAVNLSERRATVELSLRVKQPTEVQLRFVPFLVGAGGAIRQYDVGNSAQLWFPTSRWKTNDVVRVRYPPFAYVHGDRLALGVTAQGVMLPVDLPAPLAGTPYQRPSPTPSESSTAPDYRGLVELAALP